MRRLFLQLTVGILLLGTAAAKADQTTEPMTATVETGLGTQLEPLWTAAGPWILPVADETSIHVSSRTGKVRRFNCLGHDLGEVPTTTPILVQRLANLTGDAEPDFLGQWQNVLHAVGSDGRLLWSQSSLPILDVWSGNLDSDPLDEVVTGHLAPLHPDSAGVRALDDDGTLLWEHKGSEYTVWSICGRTSDTTDGAILILGARANHQAEVFASDGKRLGRLNFAAKMPQLRFAAPSADENSSHSVLLAASWGEGFIPLVEGFDHEHRRLWKVMVPAASRDVRIRSVVPAPSAPLAAVALSDGRVIVLNTNTGVPVAHVKGCGTHPGAALHGRTSAPLLLVTTGSALHAFTLTPESPSRRSIAEPLESAARQ